MSCWQCHVSERVAVENRRAAREGRQIAQRPRLGDSPRLTALRFACDSLEQAGEQLTAALVASSTMTDEPPF